MPKSRHKKKGFTSHRRLTIKEQKEKEERELEMYGVFVPSDIYWEYFASNAPNKINIECHRQLNLTIMNKYKENQEVILASHLTIATIQMEPEDDNKIYQVVYRERLGDKARDIIGKSPNDVHDVCRQVHEDDIIGHLNEEDE